MIIIIIDGRFSESALAIYQYSLFLLQQQNFREEEKLSENVFGISFPYLKILFLQHNLIFLPRIVCVFVPDTRDPVSVSTLYNLFSFLRFVSL